MAKLEDLISDEYRALNTALHSSEPEFGADAAKMAPGIAGVVMQLKAQTLLDYGCGKGSLKPALLKIVPTLDVREYDPAIAGKSEPPSEPADVVVCADVMEHIEPDRLERVIAHLRSLTRKVCVVGVADHPAIKILADGRNAHLIVQSKEWWLARFATHFRQAKTKDTEGGFMGAFYP